MHELFDCEVSLLDHTIGVSVFLATVALDETVIKKNFSLSWAGSSVVSTFSMYPAKIAQLFVEAEWAWQAVGKVNYGASKSLQYRRSFYVAQNLKAGDILTKENVRAIRPRLGLPSKYLDVVIGKRVVRDLIRETALSWKIL